jgi:hypothetical protein
MDNEGKARQDRARAARAAAGKAVRMGNSSEETGKGTGKEADYSATTTPCAVASLYSP